MRELITPSENLKSNSLLSDGLVLSDSISEIRQKKQLQKGVF